MAYLELHLTFAQIGVDHHMVALQDLAIENPHGQRVLDHALDRPLQRTSAIRRIVAFSKDQLLRFVRQLNADFPISQQTPQVFEPQVDDLRQLLSAERIKDDDVVHAVQELRLEVRL